MMSRLYFIFVPILICISQCVKGQKSFDGKVLEPNKRRNEVSIGRETYCCHYAAINKNSCQEDSHEKPFATPISSNNHVFWGPILILASLLVLRALSKRVEE